MFSWQAKVDEEPLPGQVVLALFGMAFHDERVRKLLAEICVQRFRSYDDGNLSLGRLTWCGLSGHACWQRSSATNSDGRSTGWLL